MTDKAHILQHSFQQLLDQDPSHDFIREFYVLLRGHSSRIRDLFEHVNWDQQHNKFLLALVLIVENIEEPNEYNNTMEAMGRDHLQKYGVTRDMLPVFRSTLLNTLSINLRDSWTPEIEQAWTDAINAMFEIMFPPAERADSSEI